jgi:hypothetical protein
MTGYSDGKASLELHYWTRDTDNYRETRSRVLRQFNRTAVEQGLFESPEAEEDTEAE